jgi:hypothetical protein
LRSTDHGVRLAWGRGLDWLDWVVCRWCSSGCVSGLTSLQVTASLRSWRGRAHHGAQRVGAAHPIARLRHPTYSKAVGTFPPETPAAVCRRIDHCLAAMAIGGPHRSFIFDIAEPSFFWPSLRPIHPIRVVEVKLSSR